MRIHGLVAFVVALACVFSSCDDSKTTVVVVSAPINLQGPAALPDGSYDYNLTILFTNDIHGQIMPVDGKFGGMARHAHLMQLLQQEATERGVGLLACNAGDNFEGTIFHELDGGVLLFQLMEAMGYDCTVVGNHDHQFGAQWLYDVIEGSFPGFTQNMKFLWGNVNPSRMSPIGTDPTMAMAPFVPAQVEQAVIDSFENAFTDFDTGAIDPGLMDAPTSNSKLFNQTLFYDRNGIRIGVFGLDTDEALYSSVPGEGDLFLNPDGLAENMRFYPPATHSFASDMIDYLSDPDGLPTTDDGADIIVAVTHLGVGEDLDVAVNSVGSSGRHIDVIVSGHSHTQLNRALEVSHGNGETTYIVQAGARGQFLGRLDLDVDTATDTVTLRNTRLLQVDHNIPDDPGAVAMISAAKLSAGGLDQTFNSPFETVLAANGSYFPGGVAATSALGSLAADACRSVANGPPNNLDLDIVVIGNFVFRSDICEGPVTIADAQAVVPLHLLDQNGLLADQIDYIDLPGGLREAADPSSFPIPAPNITNITTVEYMLELVYGVSDILALIGGFLGLDIGGVDQYIAGLQWSGVEFVVDLDAPPMDRIDPATIFINGVPLVGNENTDFRMGLNAVIARVALSFFQLLVAVEDPPGSTNMVPFPTYDPMTNATGLAVWECLRDHLASLGTLTLADARVTGDARPRTLHPDLTFNPVDVVVNPTPGAAGTTVDITIPVINIGETAVTDATVTVTFDPTPADSTDNPDGLTDGQTGFVYSMVGSATTGPIPAYDGTLGAGQVNVVISFPIPAMLAPGSYPVFVDIDGVTSATPGLDELVTENNGGEPFRVLVPVQ